MAKRTSRRLRLLSSALLATLAGIAPAFAETLQDALAAAHRNNPDLQEARLAVRAAQEDRVQARSAYLPSVDVSASYGVRELDRQVGQIPSAQGATDLSPQTTTARVTQPLFTGGRRGAQMRLSRASIENANQGLRAREQDVLLAAVEAYANVRRDEEVARLRQSYVEGLAQQRTWTLRRLEVGEVTRTDLAQVDSRLAGARAALATARANLQTSRGRYEEVVGQQPENLTPAAAPPQTPGSLEEATRLAETEHPVLLQARENERAAKARVGVERAALLPQLSVVGRFDRQEEDEFQNEVRESSSALAEVTVPLFEGGYAWSRTRQSRVNVQRAQTQVESRRREIVARVNAAWNNAAASREVLTAADEQVEAARAALRGAQREQGLGMRSTIDVLDAEREWQEALIAQARAAADALVAAHALLAASGGLSMANLGLAE